MIGTAGHIRGVDENMGVDVDQPRHQQPALGADRTARVRGRQRRRDSDNLTAGDADIHQAAQPAGWIEHLTAGKQKVVFHWRSFPSQFVDHSRPSGRCGQLRLFLACLITNVPLSSANTAENAADRPLCTSSTQPLPDPTRQRCSPDAYARRAIKLDGGVNRPSARRISCGGS
jgi:hypothetical protein